MRFSPFVIALLTTTGVAHAGDKPLYEAAPTWIVPALALDATKLSDNSPALLIFDNQQRLEDGRAWSYVETATRAVSSEALSAIGTVNLQWQPSQGDLIVHRAEIIRGAEHIDLIKGGNPLTILRREQGMEQRILDGVLTATMPVEGLRVGDVVHLAFSITRRDPTLKGEVQAFAPVFADPVRLQFGRVRLSWPEKAQVAWKGYADGLVAEETVEGGFKTLTFSLPLPKQTEVPGDAPARFSKLPVIEATSFTDWAAVSKVMVPLYATAGLIAQGSPLAEEVAKIKAAQSDPLKRAALALELVQGKVRYLLLGMDTGNYVPQTPAKTWEARYGDCKAKTLLLLAILHELGIEAEPVIAHSKLGDLVPKRLPSAAAFDHVLVRATINGEILWLDGTAAGARLADIRDTPPFGYVLPLRVQGADLVKIDMRPTARPDVAFALNYDQSAGVRLPAPFTGTATLKGQVAEVARMVKAQGSKDDFRKFASSIFKTFDSNAAIVSQDISFDEVTGTAAIAVSGISYLNWQFENERLRFAFDRAANTIEFNPDRARAAWKDIPVMSSRAITYGTVLMRIRLPHGGAGFTIEGTPTAEEKLAGNLIDRSAVRDGEWLVVKESIRETGEEIPAASIPTEKRRLSAFKANQMRAIAPANYPAVWEEIASARKERRLEAIQSVYTRQISDRPEDVDSYTDRAWFLERVYDRKGALADLDKAISIEPSANIYLKRARIQADLGDDDKALADALEAAKLDPSDDNALNRIAYAHADRGETDAALELIQERIDQGGKNKASYMASKAELQLRTGDKDGAIETIDSALAMKPSDPNLLNSRCWLKGIGNVGLDGALKDCTKSIELSDSVMAPLDSRAMVYYRMGRFDDALADLNAALEMVPDLADSLYMRGVIMRHIGRTKEGDADLAAARLIAPQIDKNYKRYGITP